MTNPQRGIVIGPILFVVAILAVLAAAIAAGSGVFSGDTSAVKAKAQAAAILEYANEVKMAVDRVRGHGCSDTEVSFETSITGYPNPNAPSDKSCHVFDVNGGGIILKKPQPDWLDPVQNGPDSGIFTFFGGNSVKGFGGPLNQVYTMELIFRFHNLKDDICRKLNELVGIDGIPDNVASYSPGGYFTGAYGAAGQIGAAGLEGHMAGCFHSSTAGLNHNVFYQVLIVR